MEAWACFQYISFSGSNQENKFFNPAGAGSWPEEVKDQHVPMISEEQYYKVQAVIDGRNPNKIALARRTFENEDFPLRRIVRCAKCSVGLTGAWSTGKLGKKYAYYWCASKCNYKYIPVKYLEDTLISLLKDITPADREIEDLRVLRRTLVEKT